MLQESINEGSLNLSYDPPSSLERQDTIPFVSAVSPMTEKINISQKIYVNISYCIF